MPDKFSKEMRSKIMSNIRSNKTKPELILKIAIQGLGFSYQPKLLRKPDFANKKKNLVIFVHGCFWHSCPLHGHKPKSNKGYWLPKMQRTTKRDKKNKDALTAMGYKVISFWEHDIINRLGWCVEK